MGKLKRKGKTNATKADRPTSITSQHYGDKVEKPGALADQILQESKGVRQTATKKRVKQKAHKSDSNEQEQVVSDRLTAKILDEARKQQEELEEEYGSTHKGSACSGARMSDIGGKVHEVGSDDSDIEDDDDIGANDYYDDIHIDPSEERALEMFMSKGRDGESPAAKTTLADVIMSKISEKQSVMSCADNGSVGGLQQGLDPRVIDMYTGVRKVLSKYRSGKLPKAFKILPSLANWEQLLYLTGPEEWSAAAMYQATRIFASNLNPLMAQRFYNLVLLPRIRDDIAEYKRLNFHLYAALQKALFKPAAWFKGILLPLCECGSCTLREALIVSSVVTKCTVPMLHSAACLLKLCDMDYTGSCSIFLRTLLDKKYALPYRVVDGLVHHFLRFERDRRELPVLWHQSLLTFVQHYKGDISGEQREALQGLCRAQRHEAITREVQRELAHATTRD